MWIFKIIRHLVLLAVAGAGPAETVPAQTPPEPPPAEVRPTTATLAADAEISTGTLRMLEALEAAHRDVQTVHATFEQVRVDEVFLDEVKSEGELWYRKPDHLRSDYVSPDPMTTLILPEAIYSYVPELNQVEFLQFESAAEREQQLHHLLIAFGLDTEALVRIYEIHSSEDEAGPLAKLREAGRTPEQAVLFTFEPRAQYLDGSPFLELELTVDKATHLPQKIWYRDFNEAHMTLTMKTIQTDVELSPGRFDRERIIPDSAQYINRRRTP